MSEETLILRTLRNPRLRDAITFLCDLLGCTRYRAARILVAGKRAGYSLERISQW